MEGQGQAAISKVFAPNDSRASPMRLHISDRRVWQRGDRVDRLLYSLVGDTAVYHGRSYPSGLVRSNSRIMRSPTDTSWHDSTAI